MGIETTTENPGQIAAELWQRWVAATQEIDRVEAEVAAAYRQHLGVESYSPLCSRTARLVETDALVKRASALLEALVSLASRQFSPAGAAALEIPADRYRERFIDPLKYEIDDYPYRRFRAEQFDPAALWAALEADYGGDQGERHHHRTQAAAIIEVFGLGPGVPVQRRKGGIVISRRLWKDRYDTAPKKGHFCMDFEARRALMRGLEALGECAVWADDHIASFLLRQASAQLWRNSERVWASGHAFDFGGGAHVKLFSTRADVVLMAPLSDKLPLYLSLYGGAPSSEEDAA